VNDPSDIRHPTSDIPFDPHVIPAMYVTGDLPPLGGWIKERPEDFLVDEQPAYQPSGEGEHLYMFIEKRGLSTLRAARILAQHFGVHERAVGYAGLKDKQAITRQVFSVHIPGKKLEQFPSLQHERMGVLWADYHANKLRPGHLAGNRFSIRVRGVSIRDVIVAQKGLMRLEKTGVPNRFGEQRFGYRLRNHLVGRALLLGDAVAALDALLAPIEGMADQQQDGRELYVRGEYGAALHAFFKESRTERRVLGELSRGASAGKAVRAIDRSERDFFLTAFQSAVFNAVLDERLRAGTLGTLQQGDLAFKHDSGAVFAVGSDQVGPELNTRAAAFEVSPSGPLWGAQMMRAGGATGAAELAALEASGVTLDQLGRFAEGHAGRPSGARRPLRIRLTDPEVEAGADEHGPFIRVAFDLPRGGFATTVLRELIKPPAGGSGLLSKAAEADEPD
jgi:tRNA pseudouridine13 synthase